MLSQELHSSSKFGFGLLKFSEQSSQSNRSLICEDDTVGENEQRGCPMDHHFKLELCNQFLAFVGNSSTAAERLRCCPGVSTKPLD